MKTHTKVAVIGGGVVGCSVLFHLTKLGWTDVVLIERSELTSGSTWHAAGGFHTLNADTNMAALQGYTIRLYKELEELTGQSCGLHHVGGMTLATDSERFDMLKAERAKHRYMGLETEILSPTEIKEHVGDFVNLDRVLGALYDPLDGHLDPSGTTHAYAKAAKMAGAEIVLRNPVLETNPRPDGSWEVVTEQGTLIAEHIVNAAGLWAREVGMLAGVYLPLHPMEHQYMITEAIPEFENLEEEFAHVLDPSCEAYLRQEGKGICIGFYEHNCIPWAVNGTPADFGHELLEPDLDRIGSALEQAWQRFPILENAGIKQVINGPFTFAPDGNPLVGPVPGLKNYWSACAVMAGFSQAGGVGLSLAQWMIDGEPETDIMGIDVARFGDWITPGYTRDKVKQFYQRRFSVSYPNEELPAARPHRTTPMHTLWQQNRAVFGEQYGIEAVNYFALPGESLFEQPSFRRSNAFLATAQETHAVRNHAGLGEISNFGKYRIAGKDARTFLDRVLAGRIPKQGRVALNPMLSHKGRIIGDFTVTCLNETLFQLTGSYGAQAYHMRWFNQQLEAMDGLDVTVSNVSDHLMGFQIAGPDARNLLQDMTDEDVSNDSFKFLDARVMSLNHLNALVQRVTFTGDLGYEIFVDSTSLVPLYRLIRNSGAAYGVRPFGVRALMSMRLDRLFGSWMREFRPDYTPAETGLDRFIDWKKSTDFIGKSVVYAEREAPPARQLCHFIVDANDSDVVGYEPISINGKVSGFCTSGGYSHHLKKSIAYGFVPREHAQGSLEAEIEILGEHRKATRITETLFTPSQ